MATILLLHGAIGAASQLQPLAGLLRKSNEVHLLDFEGHGGRASGSNHFSIARFAENVLSYLDDNKLEKVCLFGYSMGGYVGMYLASLYPERIERIATLATKWHWDPETAAREVKMLQPEVIKEKLPAFAETLAARHNPADWKSVLRLTADMLTAMGERNPLLTDELTFVKTPALLLIGGKDKMVSVSETEDTGNALPYATVEVLDEQPHPIEAVDMDKLSARLHDFFTA